jgi:ABC-type transporter Mla subunit MlaD
MALQDLTPQLRTRMGRMERWVGLFVIGAAVLLLGAFAYYIAHTAHRKGWFLTKVPYFIYVRDATGLKPGDRVKFLGWDIGQIRVVETTPSDPWFVENNYNVFIKFQVWEPYFGYIWTDSRVRIQSSPFLGTRYLEVSRGATGLVTVIDPRDKSQWKIRNEKEPDGYGLLSTNTTGVWLPTDEPPPLTDRAEGIIRMVQDAVPRLTNQISELLVTATATSSNLNTLAGRLQSTLEHVEALAARVRTEEGAIGRMLLTTNLQELVETTLTNMNATLTNTTALLRTSEGQLLDLTRRVALTLDNVAAVTSNLNSQVQANSFVLGEVSSLVGTADDALQGLKRHWLLRSAFRGQTNRTMESVLTPSLDVRPPL